MKILRWCVDEVSGDVAEVLVISATDEFAEQFKDGKFDPDNYEKEKMSWWGDEEEANGWVRTDLLSSKASDSLTEGMVFIQVVEDDVELDPEEYECLDKILELDGQFINFTKQARQASKELYSSLLRE